MLLTFGDISHHGPVLLAWVLLRHTLRPEEVSSVIRRLGHTTLQLGVFQYLTNMLQAFGSTGNNVNCLDLKKKPFSNGDVDLYAYCHMSLSHFSVQQALRGCVYMVSCLLSSPLLKKTHSAANRYKNTQTNRQRSKLHIVLLVFINNKLRIHLG